MLAFSLTSLYKSSTAFAVCINMHLGISQQLGSYQEFIAFGKTDYFIGVVRI